MLRFATIMSVALAVGVPAYAQSVPHSRPSRQTAAPAAQTSDDPNDIGAVPRNVQKWFGSAVDDILTGPDKHDEPGRGK